VSELETQLAAALAALASDDDEAALERLVAAWNAGRTAALIPLVDALASRIEPRHKALAGKTADDRYEAFRTTAIAQRQADLGRLVSLLPKLGYGDLSTALDTLLYQWAYTPRMRALLEPLRLAGYGDRLAELREKHATPDADVELSTTAVAQLAELERLLTADDAGADLLAQVYADPSADAPRLVYADWATSRGDPRGELISLQFARRERVPDAAAVRRERELLDHYAQRWLAPIWSAIRAESVRFERGFLSSVTVEPFAVIAPLREWSTVVALELAYHEAIPMDAFPALRELRNITPKLLAQIATAPRGLTHIGLAVEPSRAMPLRSGTAPPAMPIIDELADARAFPELTSVGLWGYPEDWTWLWSVPLGMRLQRIEVAYMYGGDSPWLTGKLPPQIREIWIRERTNELRIHRETARLDIICRERDVNAWTYMLEAIPRNTMREARFVTPRRLKSDTVERLEQQVRRYQPAIERFTVDVDPFV
jgi:uncharacterized protein (TIGR02996 family)